MPAVSYIILCNILLSFPEKLYGGLACKSCAWVRNCGKRKMEKALENWVLSPNPARLPGGKVNHLNTVQLMCKSSGS